MSLRPFLSRFKPLQSHKKRKKSTRRVKPLFETLEDRTTPSVIVVTSAGDTVTQDHQLTLREAIKLVNGQLQLSDLDQDERGKVSGTPGAGQLNEIDFSINGG